MLENDSWSHPPGEVCLASNDTKVESLCLKNGNLGNAGIGICSNNPIGAAVVNGWDLFEYDREEKEPSDLSFVGWPDIVTLEDAESMLRSFNSTFGYGELSNEDEFSWFSSQCIEASDAVMNSDFRFPFSESNLSKHKTEQDSPSRMVNTSSTVNESDCITFDCSATKAQVSNHKKQTKRYSQSEGSMKNQHSENCDSYYDGGIGPHSFGYLQTGTPFSQPGMKSDSKSVATLSSSHIEEFSNVSNGVAPMDSSLDISLEVPSISRDDQSKKLHYGYLSNLNYEDAASCDPKDSTQVHNSEVENHYEVKEARKRTPEDIDFSKVPEGSCLSAELEATSLEASRLSQLQQVMHQLDTRTQLCLRDGLYRLARSAEQRHISASSNGCSVDDGDTNGMLIDEGTASNGLMDIETETNPIDRSIAHLLFHRPSDPSADSACDGSSLKSHNMVDEFIDSPQLMIPEK